MQAVFLEAVAGAVNGAVEEQIYKIMFFSLLGLILLLAAISLVNRNQKQISLFLKLALSFIKKYTSIAYVGLKGMLSGPIAGFAYSKEQDIFYSTMDAWQKSFGYSRLYDEAAPYFGMIVDSEPIYFDYDEKRWLIEFWKGQYGIITGCEIGIYNKTLSDVKPFDIFGESFFESAEGEDMLLVSYSLYKNGQELFHREGKHWWLTGFKLGEFSQPSELVMNVSITLKSKAMLDAFLGGLMNTGYSENETKRNGLTVSFIFSEPRSMQPHSRTKEIEDFMQRYNKQNCDFFHEITKEYSSAASKLVVLRKRDPALFNSILNFKGAKRIPEKSGISNDSNS